MNYPLVTEYIESIRFSTENLDKWKSLEPVLDSSGSVVMSNGGFAVVFKMRDRDSGRFYALKCFLRDQPGRSEDYAMIASELEYASSPFLLKFEYLDKELFVDAKGCDENEFPVLLMDWVDGEPLDVYVRRHFRDSYKMDMLAYQFSRLSMWLMSQNFAHGDLKPDNVMVRADGSLVLIDYDGMFVPQMEGSKAREIGTPHFRHPNRTDSEFNEHIDDFSIISILLSLKLIAADPELMEKYGEADRLLFSEADYRNMSGSKLVKEVFPSKNEEINMLVSLFSIAVIQGNLSKVSFHLLKLNRPEEQEELSTEVTEEDLAEIQKKAEGFKSRLKALAADMARQEKKRKERLFKLHRDMYIMNIGNLLGGAKNKRSAKSSALAKLAAGAVKNKPLKDRDILKRMSFSKFEEIYLGDDWEWTLGKKRIDGSMAISISFKENGIHKVAFVSETVKKLLENPSCEYNFNVCWYAPTDTEPEFIQVQKKAEGYGDRKSLAMALRQLKNKKA